MRAIVMEVQAKKMIVMTKEGLFKQVGLLNGAQIGEEVEITVASPIWRSLSRYLAVAACILLFIFAGVQVKGYYTPYGYVNMDINPSIQLEFNKFERVLDIKGLNSDGEKVVAQITDVKNIKVEDAVKNIVEASDKTNYIKSDSENDIMFSVYSPNQNKADNIKNKVNNSANSVLKAKGKKAEIINEIVSKGDINRAELQGISVGKLKLYEKAKAVDENITIEYVKAKPVREIMKFLKEAEAKKQNKQQNDKALNENKNAKNIIPENPQKPQKTDKPSDSENSAPKINQPFVNKDIKNNNSVKANKNFEIKIPEVERIKDIKMPKIDSIDKLNERINSINKRKNEIIKSDKKY